jgi:hypothetical protein
MPHSGWLVRYFNDHYHNGEQIQTVSLDAMFRRVEFSDDQRSSREHLNVIYGMGVNLVKVSGEVLQCWLSYSHQVSIQGTAKNQLCFTGQY